jgi:hypothetical protein
MRKEIWAERMREAVEEIAEELLEGWGPLGGGLFGYWECKNCNRRFCDACDPLYLLVVRSVHKPGERLALYNRGTKLADGDEEVRKFLEERGIPLPPLFE